MRRGVSAGAQISFGEIGILHQEVPLPSSQWLYGDACDLFKHGKEVLSAHRIAAPVQRPVHARFKCHARHTVNDTSKYGVSLDRGVPQGYKTRLERTTAHVRHRLKGKYLPSSGPTQVGRLLAAPGNVAEHRRYQKSSGSMPSRASFTATVRRRSASATAATAGWRSESGRSTIQYGRRSEKSSGSSRTKSGWRSAI